MLDSAQISNAREVNYCFVFVHIYNSILFRFSIFILLHLLYKPALTILHFLYWPISLILCFLCLCKFISQHFFICIFYIRFANIHIHKHINLKMVLPSAGSTITHPHSISGQMPHGGGWDEEAAHRGSASASAAIVAKHLRWSKLNIQLQIANCKFNSFVTQFKPVGLGSA